MFLTIFVILYIKEQLSWKNALIARKYNYFKTLQLYDIPILYNIWVELERIKV